MQFVIQRGSKLAQLRWVGDLAVLAALTGRTHFRSWSLDCDALDCGLHQVLEWLAGDIAAQFIGGDLN